MYTIKKQNAVWNTDYYSITSLEDYLRGHHRRRQHFKIDPSRRTTLCGLRGAFFAIPAFSFKGKEGKVSNRYVDIYITENFDLCDVIASSLSTSSADTLLNCAWQFKFEAFQDGQILELSAPVKVSFPVQNPDLYIDHQIYKGGESTIQVLNADKDFDWKLYREATHYSDPIGDKEYIHFSVDRAGWATIASAPSYKGRKEMLPVRIDQKMSAFTELKGYLLYPEIGGLSFLHANRYGFATLGVPEAITSKVLILGQKDGSYWLGTALKKAKEKFVHVKLEPKPKASIWAEICNLLSEST